MERKQSVRIHCNVSWTTKTPTPPTKKESCDTGLVYFIWLWENEYFKIPFFSIQIFCKETLCGTRKLKIVGKKGNPDIENKYMYVCIEFILRTLGLDTWFS